MVGLLLLRLRQLIWWLKLLLLWGVPLPCPLPPLLLLLLLLPMLLVVP